MSTSPADTDEDWTVQEQPITEISLERDMCQGSHMLDWLVLHSDGTAWYYPSGRYGSVRYKGIMEQADFKGIVSVLKDRNFFKLAEMYPEKGGPMATDGCFWHISAMRGDKTKTVSIYWGGIYPDEVRDIHELWLMGKVIRGVATDIKWAYDPTYKPKW